METIEISVNVNTLVNKIKQLEQLIKEINQFKIKGIVKKKGKVIELSSNINEISELLSRLKKLIKEINNFKIKATTKKKKST